MDTADMAAEQTLSFTSNLSSHLATFHFRKGVVRR